MNRKISRLFILTLSLGMASAPAAEVLQVSEENVGALPKGKEADGIVGDFVIRTDTIVALVSQYAPLRRANMGTFYGEDGMTPGCLYDLTLLKEQNDQITIFSPSGQRGDVSYVWPVDEGLAPDEAAVETVISAAKNKGVHETHVYLAKDGERGITIRSTFRNESKEQQSIKTADTWKSVERTNTWKGVTYGDSVDPADRAGYAYGWIGDAPGTTIELAPGESVSMTRFLAVGISPAEAFGTVAEKRGAVGAITVNVKDSAGAPIPSASIEIRTSDKELITAYPDTTGAARLQLPVGDYTLKVVDSGRAPVFLQTRPDTKVPATLEAVLGAQSAIQFEVTDASGTSMPCKVQVHGVGDTPTPNFGPTNRAHGCREQWHSETGSFRVPVEPGNYRVIVTRGIEFAHHEQEVTLTAGKTEVVVAALARPIDSTGWVSTDFHNHSTPSGDNTCGTDDRLINLAAEHIEFAPTTEHNRIYDWQPHIDKLKLNDFVRTIPGLELTGGGAHFNTFPLKPEPTKQDGGAPVWDKDPRINAIKLRQHQGYSEERFIQINHPDLVEDFIDRDGDGKVDGGFAYLGGLIDAYETQNYLGVGILKTAPFEVRPPLSGGRRINYNREFIWLQLLNQGARVWALAVADAHTVWGNGVGSWRTYIPSSSDAPREIDPKEMAASAKKGRMILTTGPFLTVTANGALPGDEFATEANSVDLHVRVQCNTWTDIDRIQILVNGAQRKDLNFTRKTHPNWFSDDTVKFDREIPIAIKGDCHLIAVAIGEDSNLETGYGTSTQSPMQPCAYNNPIFVDQGGNGFVASGDTLGYSLPVKGMTTEKAKQILGK